ncbi:MAG: response regulator [Candidatus Saccharimonadales bacterium]
MARILLIEADKLIAANVRKILKNQGHQVDWRVDPQSAIISADANTPDLVILDLLLAGRSAAEFLYEFRSYPEWQRLPVIIFSNIPADKVTLPLGAVLELNIAAVYSKTATSLKTLAAGVNLALATA